ncbi:glutamine synthetase [Kocuria rhizophila]|nr:glutamine synthetase [Kocuria rhizophila]
MSSTSASRICPGGAAALQPAGQGGGRNCSQDGQLFDGSWIRGFQGIAESDMQLIPDPQSAFVDPFRVERPWWSRARS